MKVSANSEFKKINHDEMIELLDIGSTVKDLSNVFGVTIWAIKKYMLINDLTKKTVNQYLDENKDLVLELAKTTKHSEIVKILQDEYPRLNIGSFKKWMNRNKVHKRMDKFGFITMADFIQNRDDVKSEVTITIAGVPRYKVTPI